MTRALGLSAFILALLSPFVNGAYVFLLIALCILGIIIGAHRLRYREPPIDEAALQVELGEYVCFLNGEKL